MHVIEEGMKSPRVIVGDRRSLTRPIVEGISTHNERETHETRISTLRTYGTRHLGNQNRLIAPAGRGWSEERRKQPERAAAHREKL